MEQNFGEGFRLVEAGAEAEAELRVVLEQRVRPGRAAAAGVLGVGRGGQVAAVDRRATGGIGDEQAVAEELGEQFQIGSFAAAGAGPGELEQRLHELRGLHVVAQHLAVGVRQVEEEGEVLALGFAQRELRHHVDGFAARVALVLGGADLHAELAAGAVLRRDLQRVEHAGIFARLELGGLEGGGRVGESVGRENLRPDRGVRADDGALVALDADVGLPDRDFLGDVALFPLGGAGRPDAIDREGAHGQQVALAAEHQRGDTLDEVRGVFRDDRVQAMGRGRRVRIGDLDQVGECAVHGLVVALDHGLAAFAVGFLDGVFDGGDRLVLRQDAGDGEITRLHDRVDAAGHAAVAGDGAGVDGVEREIFQDDLLLDLARQVFPSVVGIAG